MSRKAVTEEDVQYLKDNYLTLSRGEMAEHLGRTTGSVRQILKRLGLRKNGVFPEIGTKINRLTILALFSKQRGRQGATYAECECECTRKTTILLSRIMTGRTKSCGCLSVETAAKTLSERQFKHGKSDTAKHRLYRIWCGMRGRCYTTSSPNYPAYGGRGITVCDEWKEYVDFEKWSLENGYADHLSIDRIDNEKSYCPDNCRWADSYTQSNNRGEYIHRLTAFGETKTISEWVADPRAFSKADSDSIRARLYRGYTEEDAITWPFGRKAPSYVNYGDKDEVGEEE